MKKACGVVLQTLGDPGQGEMKEVGMNVLAILEGSSWTQCEDIDLKKLEGETV